MYSTEGVILKRIDVGEADSLFTIYTKDFGKILARAQGIKKETAKLKGHLEPLNLSAMSFVLGKNGPRITSAELSSFFPSIRREIDKLRAASYIMSFIDKHCFDGEKDEKLWGLLLTSLQELDNGNFDTGALKNFLHSFERALLSSLGYDGETDSRTLGVAVAFPF